MPMQLYKIIIKFGNGKLNTSLFWSFFFSWEKKSKNFVFDLKITASSKRTQDGGLQNNI